jgi:phospholipase C
MPTSTFRTEARFDVYAPLCIALSDSNDNVTFNFTKLAQNHDNMRLFETSFEQDVADNDLPNYSFIVPRFIGWKNGELGINAANSQHAPGDVRTGEHLIKTVYDSIRANDDMWRKTLLIVVYDEHGGFYDHVVPPVGVPNPDGINSPVEGMANWAPDFDFTRLGMRVPAVLVSPWLQPREEKTHYEHASIPATLKRFFSLADFLTERDRAANSFEHLLSPVGAFRDDTPKVLPAPKLLPVEVMADRLSQPLDDVQKDVFLGSLRLLKDPNERKQFEKMAQDGITQHEAAMLMHELVAKQLDLGSS